MDRVYLVCLEWSDGGEYIAGAYGDRAIAQAARDQLAGNVSDGAVYVLVLPVQSGTSPTSRPAGTQPMSPAKPPPHK